MRALEAEIRAGALDMVVTESVDRLSRDVGDTERFRKLLTHRDCALNRVALIVDHRKRAT